MLPQFRKMHAGSPCWELHTEFAVLLQELGALSQAKPCRWRFTPNLLRFFQESGAWSQAMKMRDIAPSCFIITAVEFFQP